MKRKKWYLILQKKNNHVYGAFPRTKVGKISATIYMENLTKNTKEKFIIK